MIVAAGRSIEMNAQGKYYFRLEIEEYQDKRAHSDRRKHCSRRNASGRALMMGRMPVREVEQSLLPN